MRAALAGGQKVPALKIGIPETWEDGAGRSWLLLVTGLGVINTALYVGSMLSGSFKVQGVLNMGLAGSFDLQRLPFYTPVLVREEIWPEFGLSSQQGVDPKGLGYGLGRLQGNIVHNTLSWEAKDNLSQLGLFCLQDWTEARSVTVSGVTADFFVKKRLKTCYAPDIENMEGFALAWSCLQFCVPFAEIRVVSNLVGSRKKQDWDLSGSLQVLSKVFSLLTSYRQEG